MPRRAFPSPVVFAAPRLAADTLSWSQDERGTFVTVVAKVAFAWRNGKDCLVVDHKPLVVRERHRDRTPAKSLEAADELVPWLPHPELVLTGSAFVPGERRASALTVQISLSRGGPPFKKRLEIYGDADARGERMPFSRMPLTWERAVRSDDNLVGVALEGGTPNILDPARPTRAACFAPISSLWRPRRAKLGEGDRPKLTREPVELPASFDGDYFQAAPADQWLDELVGDEWLALDGLSANERRLITRLPGVRVAAKLVSEAGEEQVWLAPDRLTLDSDAQAGTLCYRAVVPIDHDALGELAIHVGTHSGDGEIVWPDPKDASTRCGHLGAIPTTPAIEPLIDEEEPTNVQHDLPDLEEVDEELIVTRAMRPVRIEEPETIADADVADGDVADAYSDTMDQDDEPFGDTRAMKPVSVPTDALPFSEPEPPIDESDPEEPFNETRAMRPVKVPPLPFAGDDEEHTRAHNIRQLQDEGRTVLPFELDEDATDAELPFSSKRSPEGERALRRELHEAASEKRGAFDDDEHTAFAAPPRPDGPLPFGPAGSPPRPPKQVSVSPPSFPKAEEPSGLWIRPAKPPRKRAETLKSGTPAEVAPPVAPSARVSENVPAVTDTALAVATISWQIEPPKHSLTVIVKGSFELRPGGPAKLRDEAEVPLGDVFSGDDPSAGLLQASDFAILKPAVDVLVRGHAYPPNGRATVMRASIRLGRLERALAVIGDRHWELAGPSDPEPFEKMPIDYTRAFGGPRLPKNPVGRGHKKTKDEEGIARLPNFEDPDHLISSPRDTPPPSCFGPISPTWDARWGLIGTYDAAWFDASWPYFAKDFDYRYFQSAPEEQRVKAIVGDEPYSLTGLVPSGEPIVGSLPGVRAHCYAKLIEGELVEIPLRADTVTFDTDDSAVHIVWRGVHEVRDEDASEIEELFATLDPIPGEALSLEEAQERYAALSADEEPESEPPPTAREPEPEEEDSAIPAELEERIAAVEASLADELRAAEIANDEAPPPTNMVELAARVREAGGSDEDVDELLQAVAEDDDAPSVIDLRALVEERIAEGEPLSGFYLRGADLSGLDLRGQALDGADLTEAKLEGTNLEGADLSSANLSRANLENVNARDAKLAGADLTDASMAGIDLRAALLEQATLDRVSGKNADLREVKAARASFVGGDLGQAKLDDAILSAADLSGANLDGASFSNAHLEEVRLYDAHGEKTSFEGAWMTGARAEGVRFVGGTFTKVRADGSVWERADLSRASFRGASLVDASFVRATCEKTIFAHGDLASGRMKKSVMKGAFFASAKLMDATCEKADFSHCDFRGANLHGTVFNDSSLRAANLDGAILSYSTLSNRRGSKQL